MNSKEIFFHVGLGKVASTFLQQNFFPRLKGIQYLPTNRYRYAKKYIPNSSSSRILVSREFDVQLEEQLRWFTDAFPNPQVFILFRRHDDWIASQYKRFVKNGYSGSFESFIDLENDGFWNRKDLYFYPMLEIIEQYTGKKPWVFFYDDLKRDPERFLKRMATRLSADFTPGSISYKPVHRSFSNKQLKVLRSFTSRFIRKLPPRYDSRIKNWLLFRPVWAFYHLILYIARVIPESWTGTSSLIDQKSLEKIRLHYQEDWKRVQDYQKKVNEVLPEY